MHEMGRGRSPRRSRRGPVILLAGHSYNAFAPEASQSVGRKLASMGVTAIPADCLLPEGTGPTAWQFCQPDHERGGPRQAAPECLPGLRQQLRLPDRCVHALDARLELGAKPYMILEIDAPTADAGVQTRLKAFLDIVRNYREAAPRRPKGPSRRRASPERAQVVRSNGEKVALTDPRVKFYLPNFSQYHPRPWRSPCDGSASHPAPPSRWTRPAGARTAVHLRQRVPAPAAVHRADAGDPCQRRPAKSPASCRSGGARRASATRTRGILSASSPRSRAVRLSVLTPPRKTTTRI